MLSLTDCGVDLLRGKGLLGSKIPNKNVTAEKIPLRHQFLVNDFRIQLIAMQGVIPAVHARFLSPTSPFLDRSSDDKPLVHGRFPDEDAPDGWVDFTPDGVLALTHTESDRPLLFFLEVDMGTETRASPKRSRGDIRQKILNYHATYRLGRYRRYEHIWNLRPRGFRLLLLAHSPARMAALSRLVRDMPPADYIYVSDWEALLSQGVWAEIWAKGGQTDRQRCSILGTKMPRPSPVPSSLTRGDAT